MFFAFAGEGNDIIFPGIEGEDMTGWLIPHEYVEEFEHVWNKDHSLDHLDK